MTGLIQRVTLRLKRIDSSLIESSKCIRVANLEEAMGRCRELDDQYEYSVVWMDSLASGSKLGRGIVMVGNHLPQSDLSKSQMKNRLNNVWKKTISCPENIPEAFLSAWSMKCFNQMYYHRFLGRESTRIIPFEPWFFPLDSIQRWNRLYGSKGFVQYQFVLPHETAYQGMREILTYLADKKLGSFLSVLKRVREDTALLPFAVPGFTLALDIPLRHDEVLDHLDTLDQLVIQFGGRIYLAKDARLKPESFRKMYPQADAWLAVVDHYNANRRFFSRMGKRLKL